MPLHSFLVYAALLLGAAVVMVPLTRRLGLGSVLGYLLAGAALGPWGLKVWSDVEGIRHLSELGVVMLMFLIGLELLPEKLWQARRAVFGLGGAQMLLTTGLLFLPLKLLLPWQGALAVAASVALSSTAIALQTLEERGQLASRHGRHAFAILLLQDLAVIPLVALLPLLAGEGMQHRGAGTAFTLLAFGASVAAGHYLLRPLFRAVARARSREAMAAAGLLLVAATALGADTLGLSMGLGAFVAGMLLASSEFRHQLEADLEPYKGLLLGMFFMAVGMSIDLRAVAAQPLAVAGLALALAVVKAGVIAGLLRYLGHRGRGLREVALALSQGGEFAFVLLAQAGELELLPERGADLASAVVALSMALTPLLILAGDRWAARHAGPAAAPEEAPAGAVGEVIIAGFGRFGQIIGRVLAVKGVRFTALDLDPGQIEFVAQFGNKVYFGDASRADLLRAAGAEKAALLVIAMDDQDAAVRAAETARHHFPELKVIARARNRLHAYRLMDAGVERVIRETFHSSLEATRQALFTLGLPQVAGDEAVRIFAEHDEALLHKAWGHHEDMEKLIDIARQGRKELAALFVDDRR